MKLVDTHVHFNMSEFDADRQEVIHRAREAGVASFINVGIDLASSKDAIQLAEANEGFYASAGFHPNHASDFSPDDLPAWKELAEHKKVVAIGEVGLDFFRNHASREDQERTFRAACGLARTLNKPLILHVRDAFPDVLRILSEEFPKGFKGVFHCFSGDVAVMERAVGTGFHISFAGPVTYKKNDALREAARKTPADRILVETDAPFLPPQSSRGKRNEPALMVETARGLADARALTLDELARETTENACRLFGIGNVS